MVLNLWTDVRHAARTLGLNPGFAAAAVLTIAVGIGINTALFSVLNGLALRDLPAPDSHELVTVNQIFEQVPRRNVNGSRSMFSTAEYRTYRDATQTVSGLTGYVLAWTVTLGGAAPREVVGSLVTCNFFTVLKQTPVLGSALPADCDVAGRERVIVLGHDLWVTAFGADPAVVGRSVELNRQLFTVVGVAPEGFNGVDLQRTSFYVPAAAQTLMRPDRDFYGDEHLSWLTLIGRRKPGVSIDEVRAELAVIAARIDSAQPGRTTRLIVERANRLSTVAERRSVLSIAGVIMSAFGLVLLVACANVANLLLARGVARSREIAMRVALGASRGRLVQHVLAESVLISVVGGAAGSLLAFWLFQALPFVMLSSLPGDVPPFWIDASPDLRVLVFVVGVSLVTGVIFGLVPALHASRPDLNMVLKQDASAVSGRDGWSRATLIGLQVGVCVVLIGSASLLLRGLYAAQTVDPGFTYDGVTVASFDLRGAGYDEDRAMLFHRQLMERAAALPGVMRVAQARRTPLAPGNFEGVLRLPEKEQLHRFGINHVSPDYFSLVDIPIVLGRAFTASDLTNTSGVVIVPEATARHYWPGENPLGKILLMPLGPDQEVQLEVVGVAKDANITQIARTETSYIYSAAAPRTQPELQLLVRSDADFATIAAGIRVAAQQIDPALVVRVNRLEENLQFWQGVSRLVTMLSGALGGIALLLAAVGVYGVVGFVVSRRVREMAIRIALGAERLDVITLVLRQTMRPVAWGALLGLAACVGVSRLLASLLFGVSSLDPLAFGGAMLFVLGTALLAGILPARRATRFDPVTMLRYD